MILQVSKNNFTYLCFNEDLSQSDMEITIPFDLLEVQQYVVITPACESCGTRMVFNTKDPQYFTDDFLPHIGLDIKGGNHWHVVEQLIHARAILAAIEGKDPQDTYKSYNLREKVIFEIASTK